ncbi:lysylphosphatidylglycerol synthase transmembrane domain-containing protein [Xanthocytophaga agilis]|uniref:Lysylphosphatidylglycerol synthase transmembrane domain-containing protein n=1 Tax=Xanthocytophaga agilis TaxID=3048010 RepID=A0AAE3R7Z9_9BACT|nr:lysylphosphatidylglycerol synthase transmembrane domain-containing protein [Xanthocytophaga agilis]MDJ1503080.1 lysylphosphatidylglycerol synthase transmembrane domain-containing protein [Xanthocytophaga agilis]
MEPAKKEETPVKAWLKLLLKVSLTGTALYLVSLKISWQQIWQIVQTVHSGWMFGAFVLFNASKIVSALRLQYYWDAIGLRLSSTYNLKLYYTGMFYNLLLPGGIGGDGYKVWLLGKDQSISYKKLISATILDRISGLFPLQLLLCLLLIKMGFIDSWYLLLLVVGQIAFYLGGQTLVQFFFKDFTKVYHITNLLGMLVQILQVTCALFIVQALDIHSYYVEYVFLFLLSSIMAVLPITIAGIGAREVVGMLGSQYLPVDSEKMISLTLLFFAITTISSLTGIFLKTGFPIQTMKNNPLHNTLSTEQIISDK